MYKLTTNERTHLDELEAEVVEGDHAHEDEGEDPHLPRDGGGVAHRRELGEVGGLALVLWMDDVGEWVSDRSGQPQSRPVSRANGPLSYPPTPTHVRTFLRCSSPSSPQR